VKVYSREIGYGISSKVPDSDKKIDDSVKNKEYADIMAIEKECY
jgi:hypothetical protein